MDVSTLLEAQTAKFRSTTVERPLDVDPGLLMVTDFTPIDVDDYTSNLEDYLKSTARDGIQALIAALYALPTQKMDDIVSTKLPELITQLPRAKPLPKPKVPTKWERFAAAKGIQKKRRDKRVWDEEKQEWVNRWGLDGKNKEKEVQWIHEVKANADVGFDPVQAARSERKSRVAKNERQRLQNLAHAETARGEREQRKSDIEKTLAATRISTASMGKFDKKLEGDKKMRGVKRKFEPTERSADREKDTSLSILSQLDGDAKRARKEKGAGDDTLNVRKAVRTASKGKGGVALGRELSARSSKKKRSRR